LRMRQFVWISACFENKQMCVKFCVHDDRLLLLRLHPAYNPNQFGR
jgi:hypothetical protein